MKLETRIARLEASGATHPAYVVDMLPGETAEAALARYEASPGPKAKAVVVLPTVAASSAEWLAAS